MKTAGLLQDIDRPRVVPGGVADSPGKRLYLPAGQGGIAALDAATGKPLWISGEGSLPLMVVNGALLAAVSREKVNFVLLDAGTGEPMLRFTPAPGLVAGSEWRVKAVWREKRLVRISWRSQHSRRIKGVPQIKEQEGGIALNLDTGHLTTSAAAPPVRQPEVSAELTRDLNLLPATDGTTEIWQAGDYLAALAIDGTGKDQRLLLCTWNLRKDMAVKRWQLLPVLPRSGYLEYHRSPDVDNVFLLLCNDTEENGRPAGSLCQWRVFRVSDGKEILRLTNPPDLKPPLVVIANRLVYMEVGRIPVKRGQPLFRLCAVDVSSGKPAWSWELGLQTPGQLF